MIKCCNYFSQKMLCTHLICSIWLLGRNFHVRKWNRIHYPHNILMRSFITSLIKLRTCRHCTYCKVNAKSKCNNRISFTFAAPYPSHSFLGNCVFKMFRRRLTKYDPPPPPSLDITVFRWVSYVRSFSKFSNIRDRSF